MLNSFIRKEFGVNNLLGLAALTVYVILRNSITKYEGQRVYQPDDGHVWPKYVTEFMKAFISQ
jgi:hypothetical protein